MITIKEKKTAWKRNVITMYITVTGIDKKVLIETREIVQEGG